MKKLFISTIIFLVSFTAANACEICGCGTGNYYIGLLPQFNNHFIGLRYQYSSFNTTMKNDPTQYSKDHFQSVELWGGWNIGKKWQVLAIVPFNFIHQASDDGKTSNSGIGDIAVMGNYKIFDRASSTASKKLITQQIWLGAGVKLATGKFIVDQNNEALVALANTQTGSASTDFILNGMYNISISNFGVSTGARYKINTANNDRYFFGNKFSANSIAFYSIKNKHTVITPNAGLLYEHNDASKLNNEKIDMTGGYLFSTAAGVELNVNKVTIGFNAQLPLSQNFSDNQTNNKIKGMVHVTFAF
jgi:hypothetical protein